MLVARHGDDDDAMTTINPRTQFFVQERKNILRHYLFGDKIIQKLSQNKS